MSPNKLLLTPSFTLSCSPAILATSCYILIDWPLSCNLMIFTRSTVDTPCQGVSIRHKSVVLTVINQQKHITNPKSNPIFGGCIPDKLCLNMRKSSCIILCSIPTYRIPVCLMLKSPCWVLSLGPNMGRTLLQWARHRRLLGHRPHQPAGCLSTSIYYTY